MSNGLLPHKWLTSTGSSEVQLLLVLWNRYSIHLITARIPGLWPVQLQVSRGSMEKPKFPSREREFAGVWNCLASSRPSNGRQREEPKSVPWVLLESSWDLLINYPKYHPEMKKTCQSSPGLCLQGTVRLVVSALFCCLLAYVISSPSLCTLAYVWCLLPPLSAPPREPLLAPPTPLESFHLLIFSTDFHPLVLVSLCSPE